MTALRVLRRILPVPTQADALFARRGFPTSAPITSTLEQVGVQVIRGFEMGADIADIDDLAAALDHIDPFYRSLAYEGAVTALVTRDLIDLRRRHLARQFVEGPGAPHAYMAYVGYGLLMPRLPRFLWRRCTPNLGDDAVLSHLTWLAADGYGFDGAFFQTQRWIDRQWRPKPYSWEGDSSYFLRAVDQGVGRALYFVNDADLEAIAHRIERMDKARRADMWSGIGAAIAYLGGVAESDIRTAQRRAGPAVADMAQGAAFAIKARAHAGYLPDCSVSAARVLCNSDVDAVVAVVDEASTQPFGTGEPGYEQWRRRLRERLTPPTLLGVDRQPADQPRGA
ncbi:DUF1702 family protein [Nocardia sp. NPDC050408]|uniref:DUF1702 family protein n=1 Tax=Nocardia sp. NPDC050408 TaxID=3364319 RepID=UPI00379DB885